MISWRPWPKEVGRVRVYEPGHPMKLHPGESAMGELPDLSELVAMMADGKHESDVLIRWHVFPTATWGGLLRRVWFRLTWWSPLAQGKPKLDVSMHVEDKETVH